MFEGVIKKLERAGYFLDNLKSLAEDSGGFAYISKQQEMRANLDGFFLEIISAKDFFLQGINERYGRVLPKDEATKTNRLSELGRLLKGKDKNASKVVHRIHRLLSRKHSWLWRINNYSNSARHRKLLGVAHVVEMPPVTVDKHMFDKMLQEGVVIKLILAGQETEILTGVKMVDIPHENIKSYLFKDPEDTSQENADIEVIPYCEQSLKRMREYLEKMYSELGI